MIDHRGVSLGELDLDAALARKPSQIVVDELAHTNAPGSKHVKRWQDVMELLDAGIDVHTTLNVQHVESLRDVILQITGVEVRETVPDEILERADEIELVDLSPDDLLERLADGKVYVPEQAQRAVQNFFQKGNLLALREPRCAAPPSTSTRTCSHTASSTASRRRGASRSASSSRSVRAPDPSG
jgi:two-component system sensor histidine kinase KdpD